MASLLKKGRLSNEIRGGSTVSGRVLEANGRGAAFAQAVLSDQSGEAIYAVTNPFGYFNFADVRTGRTYAVTVVSKPAVYQPRVMTVSEDLTDLIFSPAP